jgi:hypothetical protein
MEFFFSVVVALVTPSQAPDVRMKVKEEKSEGKAYHGLEWMIISPPPSNLASFLRPTFAALPIAFAVGPVAR